MVWWRSLEQCCSRIPYTCMDSSRFGYDKRMVCASNAHGSNSAPYFIFAPIRWLVGALKRWWQAVPMTESETMKQRISSGLYRVVYALFTRLIGVILLGPCLVNVLSRLSFIFPVAARRVVTSRSSSSDPYSKLKVLYEPSPRTKKSSRQTDGIQVI